MFLGPTTLMKNIQIDTEDTSTDFKTNFNSEFNTGTDLYFNTSWWTPGSSVPVADSDRAGGGLPLQFVLLPLLLRRARPAREPPGGQVVPGGPERARRRREVSFFGRGSRKNMTFRARKSSPSGNKLKKHIDATLGSGNLREAVRLPIGEDLNEWLAVNTVDFYNQVSVLYGTLMEFCTPAACPVMSAGSKYEYRWADGVNVKKPMEVSAPKYVEYLMDWVEVQLDDEAIFPQKIGAPFPPNFREVIRTILKRLFRVYAHIYHSHFDMVVKLTEEAHLSTCFKHFVLFTSEFQLIDRAELAPLKEMIESIIRRYH
ncbi:hypothetical protein GUJ93_ZPchr0013g37546 [Zizania palustris]|uniref:MOB kinase activator-like 1A n=1 Tax=Zizania palustris TaxID=103762 RepID=A0A8J5WXR7_ZIZPA|nr:hypothetical protein GUJ93_ZPchr0013g37546 [Zizania palustris]